MKLTPRYDGPPVLDADGAPDDQLAPLRRQRLRFGGLLAGLTDDQWRAPSRCAAWNVREVVTHLVTANDFWIASIGAGLAGEPSRFMVDFDPAATPALVVSAMADLTPAEVLERFRASNEALVALLDPLTPEQWLLPAEAPPGHLPIRLLAEHALWDSWVHERDVGVPLGIETAVEADEVRSCLRYAAALGPGLTALGDDGPQGRFAVDAHDPTVRFTLTVGHTVELREGRESDGPCLTGAAVELVDALSLRVPLPASTPPEWHALLGGLRAAFDEPA